MEINSRAARKRVDQSSVDPVILERSAHPISRRDIDPNVLKVLYRLLSADFTAYLVGGGVRDLMMRRRPKDFDVATSAHPNQVRELFRNSRLIGRRFRLVHVYFGPQNIEVATFRRRSEEVSESGDPMIRQDNTFGTPEEDAFRRDFTVNALFYDPRTFEVIDYVGGAPDLEARLIRSIGDPDLRMREDPVRMLRAVRFAVKLGFEIEPATRAAIGRHCGDLAKASVPRLVEETFRTLMLADAARALHLMERLGLLAVLLPAISDHLRNPLAAAATEPPALERAQAGELAPHASEDDFEAIATARNLAAMGRAIAEGLAPSRAMVLAALYADLFRGRSAPAARMELITDLRLRGFSRSDTDQMRLLLEAVGHMMAMTRISRRLPRRPYYPEARQLLEWIAPTYRFDVVTYDRFLTAPPERFPRRRAGVAGAPANGFDDGGRSLAPSGRRRRRRGGRRHRRKPALMNGAAETPNDPHASMTVVADAAADALRQNSGDGGESAVHGRDFGGDRDE
jgi:tRNA nucleotidyltransferase/poly(A) polymerase